MQNTFKMIADLIEATTKPGAMNETAGVLKQIAEEKDPDQDQVVERLINHAMALRDMDRDKKERTEESDARAYALNLCHAMIGLVRASNGQQLPYFPPYALHIFNDLLEVKTQEVGSNQENDVRRFYTEDCSEQQWHHAHHLIDLNGRAGRYYMSLKIHQFSREADMSGMVVLSCNEVEELLQIALSSRLEAARETYENDAAQRARNAAQLAKGDDFDPFLDSDDLP